MKFLNLLKEELRVSNQAKNIIIQCLIVGLLIFLSIFWKWFSVIALGLSIIFITLNQNGKGVYFLFFLFPLMYVFRLNYNEIYYLMYLIVLEILILGIKVIKDVIKKDKTINWNLSIILMIVLIYNFVNTIKNLNFRNMLSFDLGICLLYVISYYINEIDIKELAFLFLLGIVFSVFIGFFRPISYRLQEYPLSYAYNFKRFAGAYQNTNTLTLDLMIVFSLFTCLYLKKKINILYYLSFLFVTTVLMFTCGKMGMIIFVINLLIFIIGVVVINKKRAIYSILSIFLIFCTLFAITYPRGLVLLNRFSYDEIYEQNESTPNLDKDDFVEIDVENKLQAVTTGRFYIWKEYLKDYFSNAKTVVFGKGFGFDYIGSYNGQSNIGCHNTVIESFYAMGIVGVALFTIYLFQLLNFRGKYKNALIFFIFLGLVGLCSMSESFVTYRISFYFIFAWGLLNNKINKENNTVMLVEDKKLASKEEIMHDKTCKLAVITPTYNREKLISRCYESLKNQTNKNFKWYVVDDGSTDNTEKIVKEFIDNKGNGFEIKYIKKKNGGKHTALNVAIKEVKERYVTILDSDDWFTENAVEEILSDIPLIDENSMICGLGYLKLDLENKCVGKLYTQNGIVESFIEQRYNKNTFGDKCEVFKTDILKQYPFPEIDGERFLSESTVWCKMSGKYKMMFFNKGIYICEYQEGGLSDGVHKRLLNNPKGAVLCYKEMSSKEFKFILRVKYTIAYIVYSLAAGYTLKQMKQNHSTNKFLIGLLYLPSKIYFKNMKRKLM